MVKRKTILNPDKPAYICSSCHTTLRSFSTFKKKCLDNYSRLNDYIKALEGSNDTSDQSFNELQIRVINYEQLIKHENDIHLNIKENTLMSLEEQHNQKIELDDIREEYLASEDNAHRDFYQQLNSEAVSDDIQDGGSNVLSADNNVLDNNLNNENEDTLSSEEQVDFNIPVENIIYIKEELLDSEYSADRELSQLRVCTRSESVSNDEQDDYSNNTREANNALNKDDTNSNTDTDSQEFQCLLCKEVFTDNLTVDTHLRNHINNIAGLKCLICNKEMRRTTELKQHMKSHLGIKDYECFICKKKFTLSSTLKIHIKTHEGKKDYECSICKKKFTQNCSLKRHIKTHEGKKDYECAICKKKFTDRSSLKRHIKTHDGRRDYECTICKKKFTNRSYCKQHIKMHDGKKDYECLICKKKFMQSSHLKVHNKMHEGRKDYECLICKKKFTYSSNLKVHIKIHEGRKD